MSDRNALISYLELLELEHFDPREWLINTDRHGNEIPPEKHWPNIVVTALTLDWLRVKIGCPIKITSCYRAPAYNRLSGGTRLSQHQAFRAVDFQTLDNERRPTRALQERARELLRGARGELLLLVPGLVSFRGMRDVYVSDLPPPAKNRIPRDDMHRWLHFRSILQPDGRFPDVVSFQGGVGAYETFTHLDCRGKSATWTSARAQKPEGN